MQDRVPTPGKENRVRIRLDDGQTIEGVFEYADEAIVQGSAYNKENVLPDDVCTALGIDTSAEPKDAFNQLSNSIKPYKLLEKITSSKRWVCPDGVFYITALIVGGGGGGAVTDWRAGGGQGGCCMLVRDIKVVPGQEYSIVIGTGGTAGRLSVSPSKGGDTKAFGFTAIGGDPASEGKGGCNPFAGSFGGDTSIKGHYGGPNLPYLDAEDGIITPKDYAERFYTDLLYEDWYGSGGGSTGNIGGPNAGDGQYNASGSNAPSGFGGGGGGGDEGYSGGKGGSGAVLIYVRGD